MHPTTYVRTYLGISLVSAASIGGCDHSVGLLRNPEVLPLAPNGDDDDDVAGADQQRGYHKDGQGDERHVQLPLPHLVKLDPALEDGEKTKNRVGGGFAVLVSGDGGGRKNVMKSLAQRRLSFSQQY